MKGITRIFNLALISVFTIFVLLEIIILRTPPAEGYEISIYAAYPSFTVIYRPINTKTVWV